MKTGGSGAAVYILAPGTYLGDSEILLWTDLPNSLTVILALSSISMTVASHVLYL